MKKGGLFLVSLILFFLIGAYFKRIKNPPIFQPIKYNHKLHIDNGLTCTDCHQNVYKGQRATLPSIDVCMSCHEEPLTDSKEEAKIREYAESKGEIPWRRILLLGDHVYFSHMRHVSLGGIDCVDCHGEMSKMEAPPERPLRKMEMEDCIKCHRERGVTEDCNACHR
jgi:hypothetical protein